MGNQSLWYEAALETLKSTMEDERAQADALRAELNTEIDALRAKLAAAEQRIASLWYSIGDNQPLRSVNDDGEIVELWMDGGKLIMEDESGLRLEFQIGNTIALCRTGATHATT